MFLYIFACSLVIVTYALSGILQSFCVIFATFAIRDARIGKQNTDKLWILLMSMIMLGCLSIWQIWNTLPHHPIFFFLMLATYVTSLLLGSKLTLNMTSKTNPRPMWLIKRINFPTAQRAFPSLFAKVSNDKPPSFSKE
jgi:hypothetical protein